MSKIYFLMTALILSACSPLPVKSLQTGNYLDSIGGYLVENIGIASFGGQVFCAYEVLDTNLEDAKVDVYVWALCQEYYQDHNSLLKGTGSSLPVALHLEKMGNEYKLLGYEVPKDGMGYWSSIQATFTALAIQRMCEEDVKCYNNRAERLERENIKRAREYYGITE